ncbi:MAG: glycosyltransferase [Methylobacter sp.]|nr:glycosyltransferase [Methylobacter sp.]
MRVVFWGTYDTGKPRVRILIRGLKENGVDVLECHKEVWNEIEDKSQVTHWNTKIRLLLKWLLSYPSLILRYMRLPRHDVVIVSYLGHLDVLVLWPFTKLRGVPIVWDAFLSLYNTVVEDRRMISSRHPLAYLLYGWEWLASRAANIILLDTRAHADYFVKKFAVSIQKTAAVFVGVEPERFPRANVRVESYQLADEEAIVLFYGQFIPLHGIETIIQAAWEMEMEPVQWVLIGQGQEETRIRKLLDDHPLAKLTWIPWVPYNELIHWIHKADICLGIFGNSEKAGRVIPNKVFQILSSGKPLITRDSIAIRELLKPDMPGVYLVPPASSVELARAVRQSVKDLSELKSCNLYEIVMPRIAPADIGQAFIECIKTLLPAKP